MSKTKNIFNIDVPKFKIDLSESYDDDLPAPSPKELSDEIKSFRQKNHEFQATNDHETYLIVSFSCKEDKDTFLSELKFDEEHTLVDGYELAKKIGVKPIRPTFKLKPPF